MVGFRKPRFSQCSTYGPSLNERLLTRFYCWDTRRQCYCIVQHPVDLLILDDLGLHRMTQQQSIDLYELVIARHRTVSFVITSNRAVDEWLGLFDDSILGNSALDRLANASYQIVIEGASYRERLSPHRALLDRKEVVDPQT